ncbi:MAG: hypothetical protein NVV73_15720 [Cellvibrionaceae bacterium]|nr:hypothetical protein [Cellvibrionaceae bacterium]
MDQQLTFGIDVGSTTVKLVAVEPQSRQILWSRYARHETRQAEKVLEMLEQVLADLPHISLRETRIFITGSGASPIAPHLNAKFIQEVNAVTMAVEALHPDVGSVIELGGQDAKIIMFKTSEATGEKRATTSMNDKCASGTGATIDKCFIKVGMARDEVAKLIFDPTKLHHVAAKCGVFAETDIVNLIKERHPGQRNHVFISRCDCQPEYFRINPRQHLKIQSLVARWSQYLSAIFARLLALPHSANLGGARLRLSERRASGRIDFLAGKFRILRRLWRGVVWLV